MKRKILTIIGAIVAAVALFSFPTILIGQELTTQSVNLEVVPGCGEENTSFTVEIEGYEGMIAIAWINDYNSGPECSTFPGSLPGAMMDFPYGTLATNNFQHTETFYIGGTWTYKISIAVFDPITYLVLAMDTSECFTIPEECPPIISIDNLIEEVVVLGLPVGIETELTAILDAALKQLEKGNVKAPANQLNVFINKVEAQRGKKITEEQADMLISIAQSLIEGI